MGAHTNTRHSTTQLTSLGRRLGLLLAISSVITIGQLLLFNTSVSARAGCDDYTTQRGCRETAHWDGNNLKFGDDTFIAKGPPNEIKEKAEKEAGKKLDFYRYCSNAGTVQCHEYSYLAIPAENNPGDEIENAYLITPEGDDDIRMSGVTAYKNEEDEKKGIEKKSKEAKQELEESKEKIDKKTEECHTLKNSPSPDPRRVEDCEKELEGLLKKSDELQADIEDRDAELSEEEKNETACTVGDGVGWIICPAANFLANMTDGAFSYLSVFLQYDSLADAESRDSLQKQWAVMRNIANAAFIIGFLAIVYSQITNTGIGNYGIKRLLPRIIVAAILVNLSFWICTLAVDISNIVGWNLNKFIISGITDTREASTWAETIGKIVGGAVAVTGATVIAVKGFFGALLSLALPAMLSALFSILMIILILIARQALITILIIIAPLAFVAYLLPNTSKWFERWYTAFLSLLMVYPIVSIVFGGSQFAASVVRLGEEGVLNDIGIDLFSLAIQAIPLFIVPTILKSSGGVLGKIGLITNDKSKGVFDRLNKRGQQGILNRQHIAAARSNARKAGLAEYSGGVKGVFERAYDNAGGGSLNRRRRREARAKMLEDTYNYSQAQLDNQKLQDPEEALRAAGGNEQLASVIQANAASKADSQEKEVVEALQAKFASFDPTMIKNMLEQNLADQKKMHSLESAALLAQLRSLNDPSMYADIASKYANSNTSSAATRALARAESDNPWLTGAQKQSIQSGSLGKDLSVAYKENLGRTSAAQLSKMGSGQVEFMQQAAKENPEVARIVRPIAESALTGQSAQNIGPTRAAIQSMSTSNLPPINSIPRTPISQPPVSASNQSQTPPTLSTPMPPSSPEVPTPPSGNTNQP